MIKRSKKTLKTGHSAVFGGGGALLSRNDRVWGTTQHSQVESSQAEKSSLRVFRSQRGMLGEGSTELDNLQAETSAQKLPLPTGEGAFNRLRSSAPYMLSPYALGCTSSALLG